MAVLFSDDFNRANSSSIGNGWSETDASGILSINSNTMLISSGADTSARIYRSAGGSNNNITITVKMLITTANTGQNLCIGSLSDGAGYDRGFGFCMGIRNGSGTVYANDNGSLTSLGSQSWANTNTYWIEVTIKTDYARELRIWLDGGSRPSSPTFSSAATTPSASGTDWIFGTDTGSTNTISENVYLYQVDSITSSAIKTINGLAVASVKTVNGLAIASVKTWNGLA